MIRKTLPLGILFLCAIVILVFFIIPAFAQEEGFSETFDNPQLSGWDHSPEVIVSDGILTIGPWNNAARPGNWTNFELRLRLRFDAPGDTEIQYRSRDAGTYLLILTPGEILLLRAGAIRTEPSELAAVEFRMDSGEWVDLLITITNGTHTVYINDNLVINADDPDPLPAGGLAFVSHGERTTEIDEVFLTVLAGDEIGGVQTPPAMEPTELPASPTPVPSTWQTFIESLSAPRSGTLELGTFAINLLLAVAASFILSRVYVYWGASLSNRRKFAANFMLVTVTTTFIILVVRSSVALSLGLVGALSIIRFRAAIKEPEELAYLFFAISLGIGLGDNQRMVTLLSLVVVVVVLGLARLLRQSQADVNMNLSVSSRMPNKVSLQMVMDTLGKHCAKLRLIRFDENTEVIEMSFLVEFRHTYDLEQAREALRELSEQLEISFMDNKGIW